MSGFASMRLVLRSTGVAAKALRALASEQAVLPKDRLVVRASLSYLARSLRQVGRGLVLMHPTRITEAPLPKVVEVVAELLEDEIEPRPTDPALIEQEINGCKTLLLEVIRRAAYDWVLYRTSRRLLHKRLAEDAYTWLFVESPGHVNWEERGCAGKHITSFLSICNELDLDAKTVRMYVKRLTVKNVMSVGRPAEYRRRESCPLSLGEEHVPALRVGRLSGIDFDASSTDDF